jgi:hypothetical protein
MEVLISEYANFFIQFPPNEIHFLRTDSSEPIVTSLGSLKGKLLTSVQKLSLIDAVHSGLPRKFICRYLDIGKQRISAMINQNSSGGFFGDEANRPNKIDQISRASLKEKISYLASSSNSAIIRSQLVNLIQD